MRAVLLILILVVVAAIAAVATGFIDIRQTREAQVPEIEATRGGVAAQGGQTPQFKVDTGEVAIGTKDQQVKLPSIDVRPAETRQPGAAPAPAPAPQPQPGNVATTNATQP